MYDTPIYGFWKIEVLYEHRDKDRMIWWWEPLERLCINSNFIIPTTYSLARTMTDEEFEALMKEDDEDEDENTPYKLEEV